MDSCQDHLPEALTCQPLHFLNYQLGIPAADPAPGIGNDAIGTELIASVLDLQIGPGMASQLMKSQGLIILIPGYIMDETPVLGLMSPGPVFLLFYFPVRIILVKDGHDILFPVIANQQVRLAVIKHFTAPGLDIAAGRGHHCVRILPAGPVDHLPAFAVGDIGHRTGINNINVCPVAKFHDLIAGVGQQFLHGIGLILVYFTAQGQKSRFTFQAHKLFSFLFQPH